MSTSTLVVSPSSQLSVKVRTFAFDFHQLLSAFIEDTELQLPYDEKAVFVLKVHESKRTDRNNTFEVSASVNIDKDIFGDGAFDAYPNGVKFKMWKGPISQATKIYLMIVKLPGDVCPQYKVSYHYQDPWKEF